MDFEPASVDHLPQVAAGLRLISQSEPGGIGIGLTGQGYRLQPNIIQVRFLLERFRTNGERKRVAKDGDATYYIGHTHGPCGEMPEHISYSPLIPYWVRDLAPGSYDPATRIAVHPVGSTNSTAGKPGLNFACYEVLQEGETLQATIPIDFGPALVCMNVPEVEENNIDLQLGRATGIVPPTLEWLVPVGRVLFPISFKGPLNQPVSE